MNQNAQRGAILYRNSTATAAPQSPGRAPTSREQAGATLYKGSHSTEVGSIDNAIRSTFDPIEAGVRDDRERLEQTQNTRRKLKSMGEQNKIPPSYMHTMLSTYGEHRAHPRSKEALEKVWEGPHGWDRVRREAGSTEVAMKQLAATDAVLKAIHKEDPVFAQELVRTGASMDPRFIQTAAAIIDSLKPKEQTT